jgi:hypothetical protein
MRGSPACAYEAGGNAILLSMPSSMRRPMFNSVLNSVPKSRCRALWSAFGARAAAVVLTVPIVVAPMAVPGDLLAAESLHCLSGDELRAASLNGKTMPLAAVIQTLHRASKDVIKAQLCQESDRLVYRLTLLGRDGKVKRAVVDATSGAVVGER